jgi:hypothetical protein
MKKIFSALASVVLCLTLTGCLGSLIPKRVEFGQDKVQAFPEESAAQKEVLKQAVQRAHARAVDTVDAALWEQSSTNIIAPAREVEKLTDAAAIAVGPPVKPSSIDSYDLATKLNTSVAKLDRKIEDFKKDNNENAGKKIEGTGFLSVPYFVWIGGIALILLVAFFIGKAALSAYAVVNPGAAIGLNVVNAGQAVLAKGFSQIVAGGEAFKDWVEKEVQDSGLKEKILHAFQSNQMKSQDQEVQNVVAAITK